MRAIFLALIFLLCVSARSDVLVGRVISIHDGDTLTVLDLVHRQFKVRLMGIDAPENKQPFGKKSKDSLSRVLFGRTVEVHWTKRDRYGRIVGKILLNGQDVCLLQISLGMAWHYKKYDFEQSDEDKASYAQAEMEARRRSLGLWRDTDPMAPWDFRKIK